MFTLPSPQISIDACDSRNFGFPRTGLKPKCISARKFSEINVLRPVAGFGTGPIRSTAVGFAIVRIIKSSLDDAVPCPFVYLGAADVVNSAEVPKSSNM